jgi:hypothetical protein
MRTLEQIIFLRLLQNYNKSFVDVLELEFHLVDLELQTSEIYFLLGVAGSHLKGGDDEGQC